MRRIGQKELPLEFQESFLKALSEDNGDKATKECIIVDEVLPPELIKTIDTRLSLNRFSKLKHPKHSPSVPLARSARQIPSLWIKSGKVPLRASSIAKANIDALTGVYLRVKCHSDGSFTIEGSPQLLNFENKHEEVELEIKIGKSTYKLIHRPEGDIRLDDNKKLGPSMTGKEFVVTKDGKLLVLN